MIINVGTRVLTHLVVEPTHAHGVSHLVPANLATETDGVVTVCCSHKQFDQLPFADDGPLLASPTGTWPTGPEQMPALPSFERDVGAMPAPSGSNEISTPSPLTHGGGTVGNIELRRGDPVQAIDGFIGKVRGVVIARGSRHLTHLLLDEGHLWEKKEVGVPVGDISDGDDVLHLDLTREELRLLPATQRRTH